MKDITKYIKEDGKLDHQLLLKELANIVGFQAEKRRGILYWEVTNAYNNRESDKDISFNYGANDVKNEILPKPTTQMDITGALTEDTVISYLNSEALSEFVRCQDEYSVYDAEEDRYIAEIKIRNKEYPDCLIEFDKFNNNIEYSTEVGKEFLYVVATTSNIYVFNISKLVKNLYNFNWEWKKLPRNSEFGGYTDKIDKQVGYVKTRDASVRYNYKP
tara:strand:- start:1967 stop:2617 length:651 start_codon:yes stop_codon:yes gene_type:complete